MKGIVRAVGIVRAAFLGRSNEYPAEEIIVLTPRHLYDIGVSQSDLIVAKCAPRPPKRLGSHARASRSRDDLLRLSRSPV